MLVEHLQGKSLEEARLFDPAQMLSLFGAPLTMTRKKCCLLPWQAIQAAITCPGIGSGKVAVTPAKPPPMVAAC
jgi:NifU-like protein involved in Fe-S cluster formation